MKRVMLMILMSFDPRPRVRGDQHGADVRVVGRVSIHAPA
jgi:hypothetical protein